MSGEEPPESEPAEPEPPAPEGPRRLDPGRVIVAKGGSRPVVEPVISTRRYQWMIGIFGLILVVTFSVYLSVRNGIVSPGVPAGEHLHKFVAPLAGSDTNLDANLNPRCDAAAPNPEGLNVCGRTPLVLAFFVTGAGDCRKEVDAMQTIAGRFPSVQFAAVAVRATRSEAESLVRSHHWTIPIAYDKDGAVGDIYGVEICPMVELARPGGLVVKRLIGGQWANPTRLAAQVQRLVGPS